MTTGFLEHLHIPILSIAGLIIILSFYFGKSVKLIKLPQLIGYMIVGIILGPSLLGLINEPVQEKLSFITEIALGFVAFTIGLELSFSSLKKQGAGIIAIIFAESLGAFILVFAAVYLYTRDLPMALIFGSIAPASAPAGTVAVIKEYKARGSLTKALYAVVGFDDGLGIIIFGFAAAFAKNILAHEGGAASESIPTMLAVPLKEIALSFTMGLLFALILKVLTRRIKDANDIFVIIFSLIFIVTGLCEYLHLSIILTNMIIGVVVINTSHDEFIRKIHGEFVNIMPLLFIMFFSLAGTNLHINYLPSLGILGLIYIVARSAGLISGSRLGALVGHVEAKIKKYVGLGILSQAGVAIGLSLIVKHEFSDLGRVIGTDTGGNMTSGDHLGTVVLTTVTATCVFFEIIGPILTKIALKKAGEIDDS